MCTESSLCRVPLNSWFSSYKPAQIKVFSEYWYRHCPGSHMRINVLICIEGIFEIRLAETGFPMVKVMKCPG